MLKVVIVEQDVACQKKLKTTLEKYCKQLQTITTSGSIEKGIQLIQQQQPQLVFLSTEMEFIQLFNTYKVLPFQVVFLSNSEEMAYKAHQLGAFHYLVKPLNINELKRVLNKVTSFINKKASVQSLPTNNRLVLPAAKSLLYLNPTDIYYFESEGRNTSIYLTTEDKEVISSLSLKECERLLINRPFLRIHRSYIINLLYIKKYARGRDAYIILENGQRIDVGKSFKSHLNKAIEYFLK